MKEPKCECLCQKGNLTKELTALKSDMVLVKTILSEKGHSRRTHFPGKPNNPARQFYDEFSSLSAFQIASTSNSQTESRLSSD